ncbi:hypothetical protein D3C72_1413160 [compost metagenome]
MILEADCRDALAQLRVQRAAPDDQQQRIRHAAAHGRHGIDQVFQPHAPHQPPQRQHDRPVGGQVQRLARGAAVHRHAKAPRIDTARHDADARRVHAIARLQHPAEGHRQHDMQLAARVDRCLHVMLDAAGEVGHALGGVLGGPGAVEVHHLGVVADQVQPGQRVEREVRGDDVGLLAGEPVPQHAARAQQPGRHAGPRLGEGGDGAVGVRRRRAGAGHHAAHGHAGIGQGAGQRVVHAVQPAGALGEPVHADLERGQRRACGLGPLHRQ